MIALLLLVPVLAILASIWIRRISGQQDILRLDAVQFAYAFIVAPVAYIWLKFLLLLLARSQPFPVSTADLFLIDGIFSLIFMFVFAFVVIHSLTKTFEIKTIQNPVYDLFEHSEYYHLELSHLVIHAGGMLLVTFVSLLNLVWPLEIVGQPIMMWLVLSSGTLCGAAGFWGVWKFETDSVIFNRAMKVLYAVFFLIHFSVVLIFEPAFQVEYSLFWAMMQAFLTMVLISLFVERPEKPRRWWHHLGVQFNIRKPVQSVKTIHQVLSGLWVRNR